MKHIHKACGSLIAVTAVVLGFAAPGWAQAQGGTGSSVAGWAFFSAALVTGLSGIGAGIAVAYVGAAAVGAISEKPEVAGKTILYVGLAEGIAILGFGIAFIILSKV